VAVGNAIDNHQRFGVCVSTVSRHTKAFPAAWMLLFAMEIQSVRATCEFLCSAHVNTTSSLIQILTKISMWMCGDVVTGADLRRSSSLRSDSRPLLALSVWGGECVIWHAAFILQIAR
jgi:hypothetical protein